MHEQPRYLVDVYYSSDSMQNGLNGNAANGYRPYNISALIYSELVNETFQSGTQYTVVFELILPALTK